MLRYAIIVVLPLFVAGCGEGPPWVTSASPDRIALRWYPPDTSPAAAQAVAQLHCGASGRRAELASTEQSGSAQFAEYLCR